MIVNSGNNNWEAQKWNQRSALQMYHILVKMISIFDTKQTWINAGKIAYRSNFIMIESDKGFNISNPLLLIMWMLQNNQL